MLDVEREFIKTIDEEILNASPSALKRLQKLDSRTQLEEMTFYDAYVKLHQDCKKETLHSNSSVFRKK